MKKTLTQLFDGATAEELDLLLAGFEPDPLDTDTLTRLKTACTNPVVTKRPRAKLWRRALAAAACLALLAAAGGACAAEVREYNTAVQFFQSNFLPTEGLTRSEIKAVYRDITTESFTYSKTAEVIESSLSDYPTIGFEIPQDSPTPEDVEALWNYKNFNGMYWVTNSSQASKEDYRIRIEEKMDPSLGFEILDRCYFEKYCKDELVWSVFYTDFWIEDYVPVRDGVVVYGQTDTWSSEHPRHAWISKIDLNGNILWTQKLENGFRKEYVSAVLEHEDGSLAVFSRGELKYLCLSHLDKNGRQTDSNKTEVGNYGIWNAARFGDGYLVQLGSYTEDQYAKIVKVDPNGTITDSFSYSAGDRFYHVTDMVEFGGNVYLSAYTTPKNEDSPYSGGHYEISPILDRLFEENRINIPSEELTPMVRDIYTAVLLVCDPDGGAPKEFYSIEGSLGGVLTLGEDGVLQWDVESITTTYFSPYTSSHSIGGTSYVYRYTFDQTGNLIGQEKTGQVTHFAR